MSDNNGAYEPVTNSENIEPQMEASGTSEAQDAMKSILANVEEAKQNAPDNAVNEEDEEEGSDDLYQDKSESENDDKESDGANEEQDGEENTSEGSSNKEEVNGEQSPGDDEKESSEEKDVQDEEDGGKQTEEKEESDGDNENENENDGSSEESNRQQEEEDKGEGGGEEQEEAEEENSVENGVEEESKPASVQSSLRDTTIHNELLQKQANYIMASDMLNLAEFQELSSRDKVAAIVNMLNSNPDTALPTSSNTATSNSESDTLSEQRTWSRPSVDEKQRPDLNRPMTAAERERYNKYLRGENKITEMHDIPPKSRLFIGNLPLKNVSKEELFRIFSPYGHILQINIKNAFGFIQYDNPQSVRNAIRHESQEMNFGKKLILEISSSNARPQFDHGDHGTNSSSTFISSSKRPFQHEDNDVADMYNDNQSYKKSKRNVPACVIYVKRTADRSYANEVFSHFRRGTGLDTDMIFLKPSMQLRRLINDVAYDGVWGVILVNKTRNVDVQVFYKGPQGETKFDEYISISSDDAIAIFNNLKTSRGSSGMSTSAAPLPAALVSAPNPYAAAPPPPHQSYYGGYGLTPPMGQQPPMAPQQPPYVQAAPSAYAPYGAPAPAPAPPAAATPYGRYQPQLAQPMPAAPPPPAAAAGGDPGQQQLLAAIQNLPPTVVSNLLAAAQQQQQQQQQPQSNQQLLGLLQSMQPQPQQQHQQQFASPPVPQPQFQQNQQPFPQPPATLNSPPQQTQQPQPSAGNNVQSLLDSLAKLQK
ncbi:hypothetical protein ZYGR_0AY01100 [Zygosaccharomyces rouxii]|uniref:RRM domain-containing protein n=1 Tax=Zygosaccharomyces rouxii TaxID=4956 RepID=A0A1Q3AJ06_ZYGRO|nr:hypothetical protein ZYGR_0AY01100 [Zygosaccharomyces rouxii]